MQIVISLSRTNIVRLLAVIIILLTVANALHQFSWLAFQLDYMGFGWKLDVSGDENIPTWYSSASLFLCSILLWVIALVEQKRQQPFVRHWQGLSLIFLGLSLDETAALHEWSGTIFEGGGFAQISNFFYYQWVVLGGLFVVVVGLIYLRFFFTQPPRIRWLFFLAGAVFVGGALIVEMINARTEALYGADTVLYSLMTAFEELCEMGGVLIFAYTLLLVLESKVEAIQLRLTQ